MPTPLTFIRPQLLSWNGNAVTDHNRSELGVGVNRIEDSKRMANGTMRKYVIADKRTFDVSWTDLPDKDTATVDGFWGGRSIENFYNANAGQFTLRITNHDSTFTEYTVVFTDFNKLIKKRGESFEMWDVSLTMEEV